VNALFSSGLYLGKPSGAVINVVFAFSSIESGIMQGEAKDVDLSLLIEQAIDPFRERARARNIDLGTEIASDVPAVCRGDPRRLGQILGYLLSNAMKFTERGSIVLTLSRQGEQLLFRIADTGIGMNQEQVAALFNPFQQADTSAARRFGGIGLGLAISKRLAELMAGDITLESSPGQGTTFELRVPYVGV